MEAAFRRLALRSHPDKASSYKGALGATEPVPPFAGLMDAYQTLRDEPLRASYDRWLHCGVAISWHEWCERPAAVAHWRGPCLDRETIQQAAVPPPAAAVQADGEDGDRAPLATAREEVRLAFRRYAL